MVATSRNLVFRPPFERGIRPSQHLANFNAAANPVVVIVGDSRTTIADQIVATDYFSKAILKKLRRECSNKNFTFYERGIGGAGWSHVDAASLASTGLSLPSWASPSSNSWLSFVQALNPDLIIWELGANTGTPATEFTAFYSVMTKMATMMSTLGKSIDMIFSTSEKPSNTSGVLTGSSNQTPRDQQAALIRGYCLRNNYGLIDKNRLANIIRDGVDVQRSVFSQPASQKNFTATLTWTAGVQTDDLSLMGQWSGTVAANIRAGTIFQFTIGSLSDNALEVYQGGTGNFFINVRTTGSLLAYSAVDTGVAVPASGTIYWEMVIEGNWLQFGYSTSAQVQGAYTPVWSGYVERLGSSFTPRMFQSGAGGQQIFVNSMCTSTPTSYLKLATDLELFGIVPTGSGGSIEVYGGNGTNHLSAQGLKVLTQAILDHETFAN
jgi:hypothetical protein